MFSLFKTLKAKSRILAVVMLVLALLLLAFYFGSRTDRDLALGFVGFGDNLGGPLPHALFWLTNRTSEEWWWFHHVSLKTRDEWKQDGKTYPQMLFLEYIGPPDSRYVIRLVAISVSATNVPLHVVFECREQIPIRDKVEEFYQQRVKRRSVYVANGRHYFVTNEVPPNHTPHRTARSRPGWQSNAPDSPSLSLGR